MEEDDFNFTLVMSLGEKKKFRKEYFGSFRDLFKEIKKSSTGFVHGNYCFIHDLRMNLNTCVFFTLHRVVFHTKPYYNQNQVDKNQNYYQHRNSLIERMFYHFVIPLGSPRSIIKLKTIPE